MSHSISDAVLKNRVSKAHFLDAVLAREVTIGELTVIAVGRFIPGSQVTNTSAYVLTYRDTTSEDKVYCTHLLICPELPTPGFSQQGTTILRGTRLWRTWRRADRFFLGSPTQHDGRGAFVCAAVRPAESKTLTEVSDD